jgi:site-specific DNA recombinase
MTTNGNGKASLVDAVGYARRSSEGQDETSIPDQMKHVQQYAAEKGYRILRWYTETVSGDDTENRVEFLKMRADATELGDFKAVLCWNQDRFGRFDILDAGYWIYPFRRAGVGLVTVNDGPIDWEAFDGQVLYTIKQGGKNQFLQDLSRNVLRGQLEAINKGSWVGRIPYAYRVTGPKKDKRLALGDPGQVRVVQRIFREYVEEGWSMNSIAARLNAEGFVSPSGRVNGWEFGTVKVILQNPAYCGDFAGNRHSTGKYTHILDGKVVKGRRRDGKPPHHKAGKTPRRTKVLTAEAEWIVHRDHHEPIVSRSTWEAAQAQLAKGKTGQSQYTPETNPYLFAGLLRCGRCGSPLWGATSAAGRRLYECSNKKHNGEGACVGTTVREDHVLHSIADHLEREFISLDGEAVSWQAYRGELKPGDLPKAFAKVKAILAPPQQPAADRKRAEKRSAELADLIETARRNVAFVKNPATIAAVEGEIERMNTERQELQALLLKRPPSEDDINAEALAVLGDLFWLRMLFRGAALVIAAQDTTVEEWIASEGLHDTYPQGPTTVLRPHLRKIEAITVFTDFRPGKRVMKRTTWVDRSGMRRYGEKEVACGARHTFIRGEIALRNVVDGRIL